MTIAKRGEGLTVGTKFYSEADMLRMQRDAEERVREMQERTRRRAQQENESDRPDWDSTPRQQAQPSPPPEQSPQQTAPQDGATASGTTILEDLVGAFGADQDTLLIIGLILILINQKADATLILALAYLLLPGG